MRGHWNQVNRWDGWCRLKEEIVVVRMSEDGGEGRSQSSRVGEEFLDGFYSYHRFLGFLGNDVNRRHDCCGLNEEWLWWDYGLINVWLFWVGRDYHGCFKVTGAAGTVLVLCFQRQQPRKVQSCMGKDRQSYKRLDRFMSLESQLEEDYGQEVADYLNGLIGESSFVLPKWYKRTFTREN